MKTNKHFTLLLAALWVAFTFNSCSDDDDGPCTESTFFIDADGDGFGTTATTMYACEAPVGFVDNSDDIDDTDAGLNPNTVWQGATLTFSKADNADFTLPANQDMITSNVILTRQNNRGLYNIVTETIFDNNNYTSPLDTEWAVGSIADGVKTLTYDTWADTHGFDPQSSIDVPQVLHLIADDIYIDFTLKSWSSYSSGGGFSYERSTPNM